MKVAPSILACDFSILKEEIDSVIQDIDYLHIDVMDGVFVNNISFGIPVIQSIRKHYDILFDTHLMIVHPLKYVEAFKKAGADLLTFHFECDDNAQEVLEAIQKHGMKTGMSIRPTTPVEVLTPFLSSLDLVLIMSVEPGFGGQSFDSNALAKISWLKEQRGLHGYHYEIEVDGGINEQTGALVKEAGCDVVVAGSYIFNGRDRVTKINLLKS